MIKDDKYSTDRMDNMDIRNKRTRNVPVSEKGGGGLIFSVILEYQRVKSPGDLKTYFYIHV